MAKKTYSLLAGSIATLSLWATGCSTSSNQEPKSIDESAIQAALKENVDPLTECYRQELKSQPHLQGRLLLQWDINKQGKVRNLKTLESLDPELDQCVISVVESIRFPKPPKDQIPRVVHPFDFDPDLLY